MPPASLVSAQYSSETYCDSYFPTLRLFDSTLGYSFVPLDSGLYFCSLFFFFLLFHSRSSLFSPRLCFLSRPPLGHLVGPKIWYWNIPYLYVSQRYRMGQKEKKDVKESEGQITNGMDRGWPRPRAQGTAAFICNLQTLMKPPLGHVNVCVCDTKWLHLSAAGNLNKITHRSIKALNHFLCKSTLHLRNDLTVMARYRFDPPTHTLLSHIHTFILTIGLHSCDPL